MLDACNGNLVVQECEIDAKGCEWGETKQECKLGQDARRAESDGKRSTILPVAEIIVGGGRRGRFARVLSCGESDNGFERRLGRHQRGPSSGSGLLGESGTETD